MPGNLNQIIIILSHLRFNPIIFESITILSEIIHETLKIFLGSARNPRRAIIIDSSILKLFLAHKLTQASLVSIDNKNFRYFCAVALSWFDFKLSLEKNVARVEVETLCNILKATCL